MRLSEAIKLQTGEQVRCGPNDCGCDGRIYTVSREHRPCGCVLFYHDSNTVPFAGIVNDNCDIPFHTNYYLNATNPYLKKAD